MRVDASGFESGRGVVRQCAPDPHGATACTNLFPVVFDERGRATFQYQLVDQPDGAVVVVDQEVVCRGRGVLKGVE